MTDNSGSPREEDVLREEHELAPMEMESPRRSASAQFVVAGGESAEASMRAAMDPANQSLGEALRLSYRLLQLVMVVLVVLFLLSGFQNVEDGRVGVRTLFGRIYGPPGGEQVPPGLTPFWPYPVGEIVTLPSRRATDMSRAFWPTYPPNAVTLEEATERAESTNPIRPGIRPLGDGSLLTAEGDIAHLGLVVESSITDAVSHLENVSPAMAETILNRIVSRAAVHVAAERTLLELVESRDEPALAIRDLSQLMLQDLGTGMSITSVILPARSAPLAVRRAFAEVQNAREDAKTAIEQARQKAEEDLTRAAGGNYPQLLALVEDYERAMSEDRPEDAEESLQTLAALMEDGRTASGEVTRIIGRARAYQSQIEATLGSDAQRFASLLPSYLENPNLLVRQLWLEAVADVMGQPRLEMMPVPRDLGRLMVRASSSVDVMQARRRAEVERKRRDADAVGLQEAPFVLRGRDFNIGGPGRRLGQTGGAARDSR